MDPKPQYYCSKCKLAVLVLDGEKIFACKCGAAVVAEMTATVHGVGRATTR